MEISPALLRRMWPRAPIIVINGVAMRSADVFDRYGLTTLLRVAHFMAQISHESGGGTIKRESGNYRADRIMQIFGVGHHSAAITRAEANRLAGNGPALFDRVYGIGNPKKAKEFRHTDPGDGWKYRGGGLIQTTGKRAYQQASKLTGIDLVRDPDKISDPAVALEVAVAEFAQPRCLAAADRDDVLAVTKIINGGTNGLDDRKAWLAKWSRALGGGPVGLLDAGGGNDGANDGDGEPDGITDADTVKHVQERLRELGYFDVGRIDGELGVRTQGAILAFRNENGIEPRPIVDNALIVALAKAAPRHISEGRANATADDVRATSETLSITDRAKKWAGWIFGSGIVGAAADGSSGLLETFSGVGSKISSFRETLHGFGVGIAPLLAIGAAALVIWWVAHRIEQKRVADYRSGKNT
jgi:putative chitinase